MRVRPTHLVAIVAVAILAATAWLLLSRPSVNAPTASEPPSGAPTGGTPGPGAGPAVDLPPLDPVPWEAVEWDLVPDALGPDDVLRRVDGMVGAVDRLIAWGRVPQPGRNQFNDMGAVFVSGDGRAWREIPVDHGVNAANTSTIVSVAAGPMGYLAVGSVCCEPESVAAWHSADALTWQRLDLDGAIGGYLTTAVGLEDGWLILGASVDGSTGTVWFSADGRAWESVLEVAGGRFAPGLTDLDRTPIGIVAVGTWVAPDGSYDGGVWRSADGRHWDRIGADDPALAGDGEVQLTRVIGHGGGLLLGGIFGTAEQRRQCEELIGMVASVDGRPPGPPPHDATSCMSGWEHVWASPDGTGWERVDLREATGQLQPIEFRVVAAGGPGLVLLGETGRPASPDTTLFTSADGVTWTAVEPPAPVGPEMAIALAVRGREVVAISEHWDGATSSFHVRTGSVLP